MKKRTPDQRQLDHHIAAVKPPVTDAVWFEKAAELARETQNDVHAVLDHFDERAAIREYEGNVMRADAERIAWRETELHYRRQGNLL